MAQLSAMVEEREEKMREMVLQTLPAYAFPTRCPVLTLHSGLPWYYDGTDLACCAVSGRGDGEDGGGGEAEGGGERCLPYTLWQYRTWRSGHVGRYARAIPEA
eukprot:1647399-Rhodomonas_salina.1